MTITREQLDQYTLRLSGLHEKLKTESLYQQKQQLEKESVNPDLWKDETKAKGTLVELAHLNSLLDNLSSASENLKSLAELIDMAEAAKDNSLDADITSLQRNVVRQLDRLELSTYLSGEYDKSDAILSIHSGQGGTEAMDWAAMLSRMYTRYFERKDWSYEMVDYSPGDEAGLKSVTYIVHAPYSFGYLKNERGTHRLVRLSPFNADNLRQTSFAGVEVMPVVEESSEIVIRDEDLEFEASRSSGAGGQNVNKVSTAVRIRHIPTNIVVEAQSQRYQEQNRKIALQLLKAKLWELEEKKRQEELAKIKGTHTVAGWGTQIRSYVLHPYKLVKDLRTDYESTDPDAVLDGDLDMFIETELKALS
jgi:peptide chain release factor 2